MTDQTTSLDDIFKRDEKGRFAPKSEAPAAPETPAPVVEPVTPQPEAKVEPAPPSPTGETPPNPTGEQKPGPSPVPENVESDQVKALKAELARLRSQRREAPAQTPVAQPPKPPSVFEDEEAYHRHIESTFEERLFERSLVMSEDIAASRFTDFAEVMGTVEDDEGKVHMNWVNAIRKNPALAQQFRNAPNPAAFAYTTLKRLKVMDEIGDDPQSYREKLRKEIEAELAAKTQTQPTPAAQPAPAKPAPVIPQTLAGTGSKSQAREAPEFNGPKPLEDIMSSRPHLRQR